MVMLAGACRPQMSANFSEYFCGRVAEELQAWWRYPQPARKPSAAFD
jgi:hypothetical protein